MIGERRMLFEERFPVYTEFTQARRARDRRDGARRGRERGRGDRHPGLPTSPSGKFRVKMEVREDLHPLIGPTRSRPRRPRGSSAASSSTSPPAREEAPQVPDGGTIPGREPFAIADLLQQASDTITLVNETVDDAARRRRDGGQAGGADRRGCARAGRGRPSRHRSDRQERQPDLARHAARWWRASTRARAPSAS